MRQRSQEKQANSQRSSDMDKIASAISGLKLQIPETQKMQWELSIEGLLEMLEMHQEKMDAAVEAIKNIKPEVTVEAPDSEVRIANIDKTNKILQQILEKDPKAPSVVVPNFPDKISISNLKSLEDSLDSLLNALKKEDEEPIGYRWNKDSTGKLKSFTEIYEDHEVTSTGWNIGRVSITDVKTN